MDYRCILAIGFSVAAIIAAIKLDSKSIESVANNIAKAYSECNSPKTEKVKEVIEEQPAN